MGVLHSTTQKPKGGAVTYPVSDYAYNFTGGNHQIYFPTQTVNDVLGSGEFTLLGAYNPDTLGTSDTFASWWDAGTSNRSILCRTDTSSNFEVVGSNNGVSAWRMEGSHGMSTGTWYFIAVVISMSEPTETDRVKVYVNGSALSLSKTLGTVTSVHTPDYTTDGVEGGFGGRGDVANTALDGYAHEFSILDIPLTSAQVSALGTPSTVISPRDNHNANVIARPDMSSGTWNGFNYDFDDEMLGAGAAPSKGTINGNLSSTGGMY